MRLRLEEDDGSGSREGALWAICEAHTQPRVLVSGTSLQSHALPHAGWQAAETAARIERTESGPPGGNLRAINDRGSTRASTIPSPVGC